MDLSAAQHQLHHHYLSHHHQQQRQQSLDSMIACSSKQQPTSITHPHRDENNNNNPDPNPNSQNSSNPNLKPRPADSEAQRCPRCDSTNTKFCYYNNYSLSQPRYFCKGCRRYWTKGGTLRNVPVGGGCRKSSSALTNNKRPSSPNSSFILKRAHTHHHHDVTPSNPTPPPPFYGGGNYASGLTDSESALLPNPQAFGFFDSLRQGNGGLFQSLCYGAGEAVNAPFDDGANAAFTMMKQENEGRALWGFPSWQAAGSSSYSYGEAGAVAAADVEPVRGSWNGLIGNSAWHQGLLNTPALI